MELLQSCTKPSYITVSSDVGEFSVQVGNLVLQKLGSMCFSLGFPDNVSLGQQPCGMALNPQEEQSFMFYIEIIFHKSY